MGLSLADDSRCLDRVAARFGEKQPTIASLAPSLGAAEKEQELLRRRVSRLTSKGGSEASGGSCVGGTGRGGGHGGGPPLPWQRRTFLH